MFEHRSKPLLSRRLFFHRMLESIAFSVVAIFIALSIGILGYHITEHLGWLDSLLNASMILGGMGPVDPVKSTAGKLFASFYALFSGLVFVGIAGMLFAPMVHRFLHKFHLDVDEDTSPRRSVSREQKPLA